MDVLMPQLGETVAEGTVANWYKQEGDEVRADEILLDVETDKVSMEIPAPQAGTLEKILVAVGETVDVGTVLAVIQAAGDADAAAAGEHASTGAESGDTSSEQGSATSIAAAGGAASTAAGAAAAEPRPAATAASAGGSASATTPAATRAGTVPRSDQQRLSPAVRRLISEHDLDIGAIHGTGRNGRITRRNVIEFIQAGGATRSPPAGPAQATPAAATAPPPAAAPEPAATPRPQPAVARREPAEAPARSEPPPGGAGLGAETIPFSRIRRLTAEHMVKSKATSPHVLQAVEVDYTSVERVRNAYREIWKTQHGYSLTYLPFIAHAVCTALGEFPHANGRVGDNELILHDHVNLAIAVDLGPGGLVAPVIKSAETKTLPQLAEAIHDLAAGARSNRLSADDLSGGTYTLSNSGTFGTLITAPIINQPQVAILSTDGVRKKPVVIEHPDGDSIAIRPVGVLAQSFDHRAFDGAYSAAFLDRVRRLLEQTDWFREL